MLPYVWKKNYNQNWRYLNVFQITVHCALESGGLGSEQSVSRGIMIRVLGPS